MTAYKAVCRVFAFEMNTLPTFTHAYPQWPQISRPGHIGYVRRPLAFGTIDMHGIPPTGGNPVHGALAGNFGGRIDFFSGASASFLVVTQAMHKLSTG